MLPFNTMIQNAKFNTDSMRRSLEKSGFKTKSYSSNWPEVELNTKKNTKETDSHCKSWCLLNPNYFFS